MKVIHIISSPAAGGIENYVKDISIKACSLGHDVRIAFMEDAQRRDRDSGFRDAYLKSLYENGVRYFFIGDNARRSTLKNYFVLSRYLRGFQADVIHCHLYAAVLACLFIQSIPIFYTHHSINLKVPRILYKIFDFRVRAYVGICYACSALLKDVSRKPVYRIDNAVNQDRFICSESSKKDRRFLKVVMVGSLRAEKNYNLIIAALQQLRDLPLKVFVAGEGGLKDELVSLAVEKGVQDVISFLGNVDNIPALIQDADMFLMCSRQEGLPVSLIEATVHGLPVVVTNVGGCAEVVHRCLNGIVVDGLAADEYASALRKLVDNVDLRRSFSENAKNYSGYYFIEAAVEKHLEMYLDCM